ncbi:hypothetical protein H9P43_000252 [Blastocladiella emersonii ATCC 22665]|nr:hypothetical protein H9P43_000252 [Blastocladiella emersonii ATCC 22665]
MVDPDVMTLTTHADSTADTTVEIITGASPGASQLSGADAKAVRAVLAYWFGTDDAHALSYRPPAKLWFHNDAAVDAHITRHFGAHVEAVHAHLASPAADSIVARWSRTPRGTLALIVVADQFSRHVYRGDPRMFAADALAVQLTESVLRDPGYTTVFAPAERLFLYMPLVHVEDRTAVKRGAELMAALADEVEAKGFAHPATFRSNATSAVRHQEIVDQFGRYPYRNTVLGRDLTPDEAVFMSGRKRLFMKSVEKREPVAAAPAETASTTTSAAAAPLEYLPMRVLVLHGYRQNSHTLRRAVRKLTSLLGDTCHLELVHVNGPRAYLASADAGTGVAGPAHAVPHQRAWWNARKSAETGETVYDGADTTLTYLDTVFAEQGPFDGLLGFSQGATLIGLLSALKARFPHRFAVCISGFPSRAAAHAALVTPGSVTGVASLHIYGKHDEHLGPPAVMEANTRALASLYADAPEVLEHPGGHFTPQHWPLDAVAEFARRFAVKNTVAADFDAAVAASLPGDASLAEMADATTALYHRILAANRTRGASTGAGLVARRGDALVPAPVGLPGDLRAAIKAHPVLGALVAYPPKLDLTNLTVDWAAETSALLSSSPGGGELTVRGLLLVALTLLHARAPASEADVPGEAFAAVAVTALAHSQARAAHLADLVAVVPKFAHSWRPLVVLAAVAAAARGSEDEVAADVKRAVTHAFVNQLREDARGLPAVASGDAELEDSEETNDAAEPAVPSMCAVRAPRLQSAVNRGSRLAESIALALFPVSADADPKRAEYQRQRSHAAYQRLVARLARAHEAHSAETYFRAAKQPRTAAVAGDVERAAMLAAPASRAVVHPEPEPVVPCALDELDDLLTYLQRSDVLGGEKKEVAFPRGTVIDGTRLDLCKNVVGPMGIGPLLDAMAVSHDTSAAAAIDTLMIGNNITGSAGARRIAAAMRDPRSAIRTWYIGGNDFDADDAGVLADALLDPQAQQISAVWLKRNPILADGAAHLARVLCVNTTLAVLDLVNTGIQDAGAVALARALTAAGSGSGLRHLYLDANHLTPVAAEAFGDLLASGGAALESLSMSCNRFGDAGTAALARGVAKDTKLQRLVLASNGIGPAGAAALGDAVRAHPALAMLHLGYYRGTLVMGGVGNALGDAGAVSIASAVAHSKTLRVLNLTNCGIGPAGIVAVVDAVARGGSVLEVPGIAKQYGQAGAPAAVVQRAREAVQANRERWEAEHPGMGSAKGAVYGVVAPPHVQKILSVYRTK